MDLVYEDEAVYIKLTTNKIIKTETITENLFIDLDENDKAVGIEYLGKAEDLPPYIRNPKVLGLFIGFLAVTELIKLRYHYGIP